MEKASHENPPDHAIEREICLRVASEIERKLLPAKSPQLQGADIAGWCLYSGILGGDFFDYHDFTGVCCPSSSRVGVLVGDATGHGVGSALLMTSARAYLRARAMQPGDLGQVVTDANRLMYMDVESGGHFVTLFYASVFGVEREIEWVRAGHDPALLYDPVTDKFDYLAGKGMAMGVDPHAVYPVSHQAGLVEGSIVLIGTDGLWERKKRRGGTFDQEAIKSLVRKYRHQTASEIVGNIAQAAAAFFQGESPEDDMTLVAIKFV